MTKTHHGMDVIERLKKLDPLQLNDLYMFTGFDGFEDKIQRVVKSRRKENIQFFTEIRDYAQAVEAAAGRSSQFQLETRYKKLGGNAPIMANAMGCLGIQNTCMGSMGLPGLRPVFRELHPTVNPVSVCNPGETNALEFNDGKLIMSDMSAFRDFNWEYLLEKAGKDLLIKEIDKSGVIALVDWANLDHCSDLWSGIHRDILPVVKEKKQFFFDIADPSRKSQEEIEEVIEIIGRYRKYGEVILGINENETHKLHAILDGGKGGEELSVIALQLFEKIEVDQLLVHPVDRSILVSSRGVSVAEGTVVKNPVISTGGGDNFNAGFCLGKLTGFTDEESMILAMGTSGSYVKNGKSPSLDDLAEYLENPGDED